MDLVSDGCLKLEQQMTAAVLALGAFRSRSVRSLRDWRAVKRGRARMDGGSLCPPLMPLAPRLGDDPFPYLIDRVEVVLHALDGVVFAIFHVLCLEHL